MGLDPSIASSSAATSHARSLRRTIDSGTVRVAGPFTVESLSPHRVLGVDEHDELIDQSAEARAEFERAAALTRNAGERSVLIPPRPSPARAWIAAIAFLPEFAALSPGCADPTASNRDVLKCPMCRTPIFGARRDRMGRTLDQGWA